MNFMKKEWNIVKAFTVCIAISLAIIIFGVVALCVNGLPLGIEFAGGVELTVDFDENDVTQSEYNTIKAEVKDYLESAGLSVTDGSKISEGDIIDGVKYSYTLEINGKTTEDGVMGTLFTMLEKGGQGLTDDEIAVLDDYLGSNFDFTGFKSISDVVSDATDGISVTPTIYMVGASVSAKLLQTSLIALTVALVLILAYIIIRFRTLGAENNFFSGLKSGLAAIIALIHDVSVMMAFILIAGWLFGLQITSTFVAAVVTIVAYSINNTIVTFDRIRDNKKRFVNMDNLQLANRSVKDVFARSMFTSLTTIIAILILTILGIAALREFTLPILVGLIAGTYSSLFISPFLWTVFNKGSKKVKKAE
ncbi:MAG: hypothetical protein IKA90_01000 [Clostridia bacterium]|nr:hypothetical protein [Clostridia bacterium]